ncbi:MAG: protease HtpX [Rhabdochlamydiaceae bacterium]|nr:protease HtpX [Rhabdochlamydiaceae bacterium]
MAIAKRVFLFLAINFLVVMMLSIILNVFHVQPYLQSYGLNVKSLLIFCLVWGMGGALISLALSKQMAKWMMGVRLIDPNEQDPEMRRLVLTVHTLSREAGLPKMPEVGIFESPEPNAFATGATKSSSLVAVSTGLMRRMSQQELEGVIAHEITHIANGDMVTMALLQGVVNAFVMFLARVLAYVVSGLGNRDRSSSSSGSYMSYYLFTFLFEIVFMVLGSIVVAWFSRFREFRADKGGSKLAGKEKMISALESLKRMQQIRDAKVDKPSFQTMMISTGKKSGWKLLFASHPPLETRIERLRQS